MSGWGGAGSEEGVLKGTLAGCCGPLCIYRDCWKAEATSGSLWWFWSSLRFACEQPRLAPQKWGRLALPGQWDLLSCQQGTELLPVRTTPPLRVSSPHAWAFRVGLGIDTRHVKTHTGLHDFTVLFLMEAAQTGSGLPGCVWMEGWREAEESHREGSGLCTGWARGPLLAHRRLCLYDQTAGGGSHVIKEFAVAEPADELPSSWSLGLVGPAQPALGSCFVKPKSWVLSH